MMAFGMAADGSGPMPLDLPARAPGKGEIAVRIQACGLNFADLLMAEGRYQERPDPPFALGMELAGTVTAAGPGATRFSPGDRVAVFAGSGGLAETGCFSEVWATPVPKDMSLTVAAGFQVAYGTSHLALSRRANLCPGESLVVTGAAGGVGLTAVEIGKLMGARVIAVARGAAKCDAARAAGADQAIDSDGVDLAGALRALGGVDVVYDAVGGAQFEACLRAARPEARLLTIGFASGEVPQIKANHLLVKNLTVMGLYWGGYLAFRPEAVTDSLATLFGWFEAGRLRPHVSHVLPLDRAAEALALLRDRKSTGKVVVEIGGISGS